MRIAFLNPWKEAAENQAYASQSIAARRLGHQLIHCTNSSDVEETRPDFVLAFASTQPKLTDFPTYGVIHEPRDRFLTNRSFYNNLLTYEGYLTISDTLQKFLANVIYATGRSSLDIGFYYDTCQSQYAASDIEFLARKHALKLTYFGTNWDKRRERLFWLLSAEKNVQIFGPQRSWFSVAPHAYGGVLPFDGMSVQTAYLNNGIGLCLLSRNHLADDIISNRIFEIASVGAVAICCDTPWIRKWFGDSVYYVNQTLPDEALVSEIGRRIEEIYADPQSASTKATRAKQIFDETFAAERLIENAVEYHLKMKARRASALSLSRQFMPLISVIIRCGSRSLEFVRRAVSSVARQTYGQFEIVFVRWCPIDLTEFRSDRYQNVDRVVVLDCMGGNRSATLWCGLNQISGDFFCILDDDDWLLENHFEALFWPLHNAPRERFFAYSGAIRQYGCPREIEGGGADSRELYCFGASLSPVLSSKGVMSNSFVASRDLLYPALLEDPGMATAEDTYLILSLLSQTRPVFSFSATSVHDQSEDDHAVISGGLGRFEDLMTLQVRLSGRYRPTFAASDAWQSLFDAWRERASLLSLDESYDLVETADRFIVGTRHPGLPSFVGVLDNVASGYNPERSGFSGLSKPIEPEVGSATVEPPMGVPWAFGAMLEINKPQDSNAPEYLLIVELLVESGEAGLGLLSRAESDYLYRRSFRASPKLWEIHIQISDLAEIGRLVVQNWEQADRVAAKLLSLKLWA
jgi:hypothetical protein